MKRKSPLALSHSLADRLPLILRLTLKRHGVNILGTTPETIDFAEDRDLFRGMMEKLEYPHARVGNGCYG